MVAHCDEWLTHAGLDYVERDSADDEAEEDDEDYGAEEADDKEEDVLEDGHINICCNA